VRVSVSVSVSMSMSVSMSVSVSVFPSICVPVPVSMFVSLCMHARERERESARARARARECVSVCTHVILLPLVLVSRCLSVVFVCLYVNSYHTHKEHPIVSRSVSASTEFACWMNVPDILS